MPRKLFLEVVVALEAGTEAVNGLAGLADPESNGVDCSAQGPHRRRRLEGLSMSVSLQGMVYGTARTGFSRGLSCGWWSKAFENLRGLRRRAALLTSGLEMLASEGGYWTRSLGFNARRLVTCPDLVLVVIDYSFPCP